MAEQSGNAIIDIFAEVPKTYERVNRVLTLGLDVLWRNKAAKMAASGGGTKWLDVCTGTGEMAISLKGLAGEGVEVSAVDFSDPMLSVAKAKKDAEGIIFYNASVDNLPFPDDTFDLLTISFAVRNINRNPEYFLGCLREFCRVLKPGGRLLCLETSQPSSAIFRAIFHAYARFIIRPVGGMLSGSNRAYAYLSSTIPRFYSADELAGIIGRAGFKTVNFTRMTFGACAVHISVK
jgi:demethylmenaquinone methyltransferase/2-methoxy-6-polyprenyl-1,4-benzoquinol methylase